jgi:hypothetical protein
MDLKLLTPFLISALVVWALYRRVRRNFGPQPVRVGRMQFRIGLLCVIGALLLFVSWRNMQLLGALIGGVACGVALGYVGLRHTKFEVTPQGNFYTPHTYIGLFVTALFIARILFRVLSLNTGAHPLPQSDPNPFNAYQRSPLTLAIFGVLVGYYVFFMIGVLRNSKVRTIAP